MLSGCVDSVNHLRSGTECVSWDIPTVLESCDNIASSLLPILKCEKVMLNEVGLIRVSGVDGT